LLEQRNGIWEVKWFEMVHYIGCPDSSLAIILSSYRPESAMSNPTIPPSPVPARFGLQWLEVGFLAGTPLWLAVVFGSKDNLDLLKGGWTWQSFGFALWDVLFGTAACLGLLVLFRDRLHRRYAWSDFLIRNAFSVYVFHTPVLVGITLALRSFHALPSVKFVVASILAVIATYGLSEWVFRRVPGLRAIL
jgi:glucans biosynthesis protein C